MTRHQFGVSELFSQTSFRVGGVAKSRVFSQVTIPFLVFLVDSVIALKYFKTKQEYLCFVYITCK